MSTAIIIIACVLLLLAYAFDVSATFTKIPSVILLLILGGILRITANTLNIFIPDLNPVLPILGTIGLILIVLEGSLELELNKSKIPLIKKSVLIALIPMFVLAFGLAFLFQYLNQGDFKINLVNVIPFCVISSAIAIPSVRSLSNESREFVVYESSLSDIFGVLFFNFVALNPYINGQSFGLFGIQILIIIVVSFVSVLGLSFLLSRIKHHVTFTPIILFVILIYAISKEFHLPGLIFILVFGLFLGNIDEMKRFKWIEKFRPEKLQLEVDKFKEVTFEATFLVRATFFMLFGFLMKPSEILNPVTFPLAGAIVGSILLLRLITLKISGSQVMPLLFVAPRGLITILLFLAIMPEQSIPLVNKSLVIQTVILSVLTMMIGLMFSKEEATKEKTL
ncbi:MAG: sodium:proton antiporter [Bacteroidota bacterium]